MTIWFTSDTHYGHANVIKYCNRPFETVEEMDNILIANYNSRVMPNDTVYHLGDFSLGRDADRILQRLNGRIHLILGNHDKLKPYVRDMFESVSAYKEITEYDTKIVMCHYAFRVWNKSHHGSWNLHGHSHGNLPAIGKQLDVGVDSHNYFPISLSEVKAIMDKKAFVPVDHHDGERE